MPHAAPQTSGPIAAPQTSGPIAAPQASGPIAACLSTLDKWRFCRTTGKMQEGLSPFSLPHCKQVGLTLLTANQAENTGGGGGGGGTSNVEVISMLVRNFFLKILENTQTLILNT